MCGLPGKHLMPVKAPGADSLLEAGKRDSSHHAAAKPDLSQSRTQGG